MTHGSLFSGNGGFDLAAQRAGIENIFQVEIDNFCLEVLQKNFPNVTKYNDIKQFDGNQYAKKINILSGGFPCQDISQAGKGAGIFGSKSGLWSEFFRVIKEVNPDFVVIENSSKLLRKGFEKILCDFSEIGFNVQWECFRAYEYGYPHERERVYVVANSNEKGWTGFLHNLKRKRFETCKKTTALDTQRHPFLQFEQRIGEPAVFGVYNGLSNRLDAVNRLGSLGNAIIPDIALEIFSTIKNLQNGNA